MLMSQLAFLRGVNARLAIPKTFPYYFSQLVMFGDLRSAGDNIAVAIRLQEIAVADFGRSSIDTDEHVHPIMVFP